MSGEKSIGKTGIRILKADCTAEEMWCFKWASSRKPRRTLAEFLREALEEKAEATVAEWKRQGGAVPDLVSDGLAKMKAQRLHRAD